MMAGLFGNCGETGFGAIIPGSRFELLTTGEGAAFRGATDLSAVLPKPMLLGAGSTDRGCEERLAFCGTLSLFMQPTQKLNAMSTQKTRIMREALSARVGVLARGKVDLVLEIRTFPPRCDGGL
jgi:hypothetical protein